MFSSRVFLDHCDPLHASFLFFPIVSSLALSIPSIVVTQCSVYSLGECCYPLFVLCLRYGSSDDGIDDGSDDDDDNDNNNDIEGSDDDDNDDSSRFNLVE